MKVSELIQEFVPCEICGNNNLNDFYFYVLVNSSQAYVKCCECGGEYYSTCASNILVSAEESRKVRIGSRTTLKNKNQESIHPLVKVLARI